MFNANLSTILVISWRANLLFINLVNKT